MEIEDIKTLVYSKQLHKLPHIDVKKAITSYEFLERFAESRIIYGINTGFGPMAQYRIEQDELIDLQYNLIRSHASGVGNCLQEEEIRAILMIRLNTFLTGKSGISIAVINRIHKYLELDILPEIYEHGSVGASGDLVQLAHLGLGLIGEGLVRYKGESRRTEDVLKEVGLEPIKLQLRDGLGLINGTSCMAGIGTINIIKAKKLIDLSIACSSMINEIVESFSDSFSAELNQAKKHKGQVEVARLMREHVKDGELIRDRKELFDADESMKQTKFDKKIQEYYSIRCVPQIIGPILDTFNYSYQIIEDEMNSTSDNPIVSVEDNNVFHGGNFHGDYISLEMDKLKIAITKLSILSERQLNFLLNHRLNKQFPPFLNSGKLGLNFGLQGVQYVATSTVAENQSLCNSVYVHSIPNNNDNQDIVSMGTNSAVICRKVIENTGEVIAVNLLAIANAVDLNPNKDAKAKLSSRSKKIYSEIRKIVPFEKEDKSVSQNLRLLAKTILTTNTFTNE